MADGANFHPAQRLPDILAGLDLSLVDQGGPIGGHDSLRVSADQAVRVLQFNVWQEGTSVADGLAKICNVIIAAKADVVCFSEVRNYNGEDWTAKVVAALRRHQLDYHTRRVPGDVGLVSRFDIEHAEAVFGEAATDQGSIAAWRLKLPRGARLVIASAHLDYQSYGLNLIRAYNGGTPDWKLRDADNDGQPDRETDPAAILQYNAASRRRPAIESFVARAAAWEKEGYPVILAFTAWRTRRMRMALWLIALACTSGVCLGQSPRPNIVLIMADDMGFSDIGCYGGEIATPHLDALAAGGLRCTQFYNNAKCEPTRASLLTGMYAQQVGASPSIHYAGPTFAEVLRPAGYRTFMAGKWHAGQLPVERGFDRFFGLTDGCANYFNPGLRRPGEPQPAEKGFPRAWADDTRVLRPFTPDDPTFYATDAFTDHALGYLDDSKADDKPFVLYLAYTAPHYPLHARPEDIAKYRGRYMAGWDALRAARYSRQISMGLIDERHRLPPSERSVPAWEDIEDAEAFDLRMAVYAAMIDRMDQNIGRVLAKLEEIGKADNTLILFLSDNGAEAADVDYSVTKGAAPGPMESYRTQGQPWARLSNTPLRRYKGSMHEGGIATPFIASWPGVIKPGRLTAAPGHIIDILPTFADLTGAAYPATFRGKTLPGPEGRSLVPIFREEPRDAPAYFWQFKNAKAVRDGDWKLVSSGKKWELYNLAEDRTELHDRAAEHPERVNQMAEAWEAWRHRCAAF